MHKTGIYTDIMQKTNRKSGLTPGIPLKKLPDNSSKSSRGIKKIVRKTFSNSQKLQFSISFASIFTFLTKSTKAQNTLKNNVLRQKTPSEISFFEMLCPSLFKKRIFRLLIYQSVILIFPPPNKNIKNPSRATGAPEPKTDLYF